MKATIEGRVIGKSIKEPQPGTDGKTKYQVAVNQGGLNNDIINVSATTFQRTEPDKVIKLPVEITSWSMNGKHGLSIKESV